MRKLWQTLAVAAVVWGSIGVALAVLMLGSHAAHAAPPDNADPSLAPFFHALKAPSGIGCCDVSDCRIIEEDRWRLTPDGYEVKWADDQWRRVPPEVVLHVPNPTGGAVLCSVPDIAYPLCFVPGSGS